MTDNETITAASLLADLGEEHTRAMALPLPDDAAARGWQMIAASRTAGFTRALHALNDEDPNKADEIAAWHDGQFGEGPDPAEHTDWLIRHVAEDRAQFDQWLADGRKAAQEVNRKPAVEREAIHLHFSLSYANYLVVPRTLLQSMPDEWQARFVALLDEMDDAFRHVPQAEAYEVTAGTQHEVFDLTEAEQRLLGITADWYRGETPPEGLSEADLAEWQAEHENPDGPDYHDREGRELSGSDRVLVPGTDPVPHYNRGRARIEPRPLVSEEQPA